MYILIVDPHADQTALISQFLTGASHNVIVCNSGKEAIRILQKQGFELLILAQPMMQPDGLGILKQLHMANAHIPSILLCYQPLNHNEQQTAQALRVNSCINMPLNMTEFNETVIAIQNDLIQKKHKSDQPFFGSQTAAGTGSYQRKPTGAYDATSSSGTQQALTANFPRPDQGAASNNALDPFTEGYNRKESSGLYEKQRSDMYNTQQFKPRTNAHVSTTRFRRGVTGKYVAGQEKDPTSAIHRADANQAPKTIQVRCAHCGEVFGVPVRAEAYNTMCIHCGQLNRILGES